MNKNSIPTNKRKLKTRIVFFFLSLIYIIAVLGCGGGSKTDFPTLYKNAGESQKFNIEFNKKIVKITDDMFATGQAIMEHSISIQKKLDNNDSESEKLQAALFWHPIDNTIRFIQDTRSALQSDQINAVLSQIGAGRVSWRKEEKKYYYKNRPINFYILKPDSKGKFGDRESATLELIDLSPSKNDIEKSTTQDFDLLFYGRSSLDFDENSFKMAWESDRSYGILWGNNSIYIASGVRLDRKNHVCTCVIAKPGDIGKGVINGTFPFKEDIAGELLEAYASYLMDYMKNFNPGRQEYLLNKYNYYNKNNSSVSSANNNSSNTNQTQSTNKQQSNQTSAQSYPTVTQSSISSTTHSSYDNEDGYAHSAAKTVDGDIRSCWAEGVKGLGLGEYIQINFNNIYKVSGLNIWIGHQKSEDLFYKNARPVSIRVMGSDGSNEVYTLDDRMGGQRVNFIKPINVSYVRIVVDKVARGSKYEDTCIAEVSFF